LDRCGLLREMSHVDSICLLNTLVSLAKTAEPIEMPLGGGADSRGPKEPCITYGRDLSTRRGNFWELSHSFKNIETKV